MVALLAARDLSVAYPNGVHALCGLRFELAPGELCVVIGPNGAGKSTLLRALAGLQPVRDGSVHIEGRPLRSLSTRARARRVAFLQQSLAVPRGIDVESVVMMARYAYLTPFSRPGLRDAAIVKRCLEEVDALRFRRRKAGELSGGELQRVLLARVLAQETRCVLLDEPTAGLDPSHELAFLGVVRRLTETTGRAALLVTHDLNLASQFATRLLLLHEGRVLADGPPTEVLTPRVLGPVYGARLAFGELPAAAAEGAMRPWVLPWDLPVPGPDRNPSDNEGGPDHS